MACPLLFLPLWQSTAPFTFPVWSSNEKFSGSPWERGSLKHIGLQLFSIQAMNMHYSGMGHNPPPCAPKERQPFNPRGLKKEKNMLLSYVSSFFLLLIYQNILNCGYKVSPFFGCKVVPHESEDPQLFFFLILRFNPQMLSHFFIIREKPHARDVNYIILYKPLVVPHSLASRQQGARRGDEV